METVARGIALGPGLHTLLPVGGCGVGGLLLPAQKPLATLAVNGGTQSNIIGSSSSSILGKRPLAPSLGSAAAATTTTTSTSATATSNAAAAASSLLSSMSMSLSAAKSLSSASEHHRSKVGPVSTVGKKYAYCGLPYATPQQSASVQRRNARERNRVKQVNNGFANLRQHIPSTVVTALTNGTRGANKKLSKVDTLRLAVEYIRSLKRMLDENGAEMGLVAVAAVTAAKQQQKQQQQQPTSSSTVTSSTTASSTAAPTASSTTTINSNQLSQQQQQQLSNSSVCSASSGSTYYGTMSEPSIASSPAPSHMSDGSSHGGDSGTPHGGCHFTQISGSFKHEPYDLYVDPLNSPTPSYGSDHGIGGIGGATQSYHHHHHHHHHNHSSHQHQHHQHQQQQHITSVAGHQTIVHDGPTTTTTATASDNNNYILATQSQQHHQQQQQHQHHHHHQTTLQHHQQFKTELAYDDSPYDEELSPQNPDDEELLDAISWWQQQ